MEGSSKEREIGASLSAYSLKRFRVLLTIFWKNSLTLKGLLWNAYILEIFKILTKQLSILVIILFFRVAYTIMNYKNKNTCNIHKAIRVELTNGIEMKKWYVCL